MIETYTYTQPPHPGIQTILKTEGSTKQAVSSSSSSSSHAGLGACLATFLDSPHCHQVESVDFSYTDMGEEELEAVLVAFQRGHCQSLKSLILSGLVLLPSWESTGTGHGSECPASAAGEEEEVVVVVGPVAGSESSSNAAGWGSRI